MSRASRSAPTAKATSGAEPAVATKAASSSTILIAAAAHLDAAVKLIRQVPGGIEQPIIHAIAAAASRDAITLRKEAVETANGEA